MNQTQQLQEYIDQSRRIVFFGGAAALLLACGLLIPAGAAVRLLCLALGAACAVYLALFLRRLARGLRE